MARRIHTMTHVNTGPAWHGARRLPAVLALCLACVLLPAAAAHAQIADSAIEQDTNKWTTLHVNKDLGETWFTGVGIHNRIGNDLASFRRMRYRLLAGRRVSDRLILTAGADWVDNYNPRNRELRPWGQFEFGLPSPGTVSLSFRSRFEPRFIAGVDGVIFRSRHMISGTYPLGKSGEWYLVSWEEVFLNWNRQPQWPQDHFSQNRLFGGVGHHFNTNQRLELGYQGRYMKLNDRPNQLNHTLFVQVFQNF